MSRCSNIPACYLVLIRNEKVLLLERQNTGFFDGHFSFIAGHVEEDESFTQGIIREAKEEAGIVLNKKDLKVAHIMHRDSDDSVRVDVFFTTKSWSGEIVNREPHKCSRLEWFELKDLPENIIPYIGKALQFILEGEFYSEEGW